MIDVTQFRELVVRPVLHDLGMWSEAAEDIMVGTAVQESRLTYLTQHGNGPAKGVYQIELPTAQDVVGRYLDRMDKTAIRERFYVAADFDPALDGDDNVEKSRLATNLKYATAVARIRYYMVPEAMPEAGDIEGYAAYWKQHYNTPLGKGKVEEFINSYREYVL